MSLGFKKLMMRGHFIIQILGCQALKWVTPLKLCKIQSTSSEAPCCQGHDFS